MLRSIVVTKAHEKNALKYWHTFFTRPIFLFSIILIILQVDLQAKKRGFTDLYDRPTKYTLT